MNIEIFLKISDCILQPIDPKDCYKIEFQTKLYRYNLPHCDRCLDTGTLCELPSRQETTINNCGEHDVFICTRGTKNYI